MPRTFFQIGSVNSGHNIFCNIDCRDLNEKNSVTKIDKNWVAGCARNLWHGVFNADLSYHVFKCVLEFIL